jgi:hypothetical protein
MVGTGMISDSDTSAIYDPNVLLTETEKNPGANSPANKNNIIIQARECDRVLDLGEDKAVLETPSFIMDFGNYSSKKVADRWAVINRMCEEIYSQKKLRNESIRQQSRWFLDPLNQSKFRSALKVLKKKMALAPRVLKIMDLKIKIDQLEKSHAPIQEIEKLLEEMESLSVDHELREYREWLQQKYQVLFSKRDDSENEFIDNQESLQVCPHGLFQAKKKKDKHKKLTDYVLSKGKSGYDSQDLSAQQTQKKKKHKKKKHKKHKT